MFITNKKSYVTSTDYDTEVRLGSQFTISVHRRNILNYSDLYQSMNDVLLFLRARDDTPIHEDDKTIIIVSRYTVRVLAIRRTRMPVDSHRIVALTRASWIFFSTESER